MRRSRRNCPFTALLSRGLSTALSNDIGAETTCVQTGKVHSVEGAHPARLVLLWLEAVRSKVRSGEVDFAIGPERGVSYEIATHSLFEIPFVAVFPPDHPLGRLKRVTWADLSRYPLISLQGEYTQILSADLQAASGNLTLSPDIEVTFMTTALSMVNAGLGVTTCLPYAASLLDLYGLQTRLLLAPKLSRKFYLLPKKERPLSPAAQGVADFMRGYVARQKWSRGHGG